MLSSFSRIVVSLVAGSRSVPAPSISSVKASLPFPCARFTVSAAVAALAVSAEPEEDETSEDTVSEEDEAPEEDAAPEEDETSGEDAAVPFPVSWTVKMKKKQKETQDILSYHTQAAGCSDKARAKASGGRQPIEECGRTGL